MTLQGSGTISINDIRAEFGGTNPASLNQYYRGGSFVPNTSVNSGVPTSGPIALEDFYGASNSSGDVTINSVNWIDVSGDTLAQTNSVTISGLGTGVQATIEYTSTNTTGDVFGIKNNVAFTNTTTVVNGDSIRFETSAFPDTATSGIVTIRNVSDNNIVLDTFSFTLTGDDGNFI